MESTPYYRNTARVVGAMFLAGIAVYMSGSILVRSILDAPDPLATVPANGALLATGAMLMLMAAVMDAAHGVVMLPVLKQNSERLAFGYLAARLIDAVMIAGGVILILIQIPIGRAYVAAGAAADASQLQALSALSEQADVYAYEIGMMAVGVAGTMLCTVFYRATLVPRPVAVWGLVGYLLLLSGSALQVLGFDLRLVHTIPGGLWELFIGVWLIAKGFEARPASRPRAATEPGLAAGAPPRA